MSGPVLLILRLALAAALYTFLVWALLVLWRELKYESRLLAARQAPPITLRRWDGAEARPHNFAGPVITIGRDLTADLRLDDKTVSAEHARISHHHGQWWVEDLGSTNGSFINQQPITTSAVLTNGDYLRLGQIELSVNIGYENLDDPTITEDDDFLKLVKE